MDKSNPDRIRLLDDLLQIMITHWGVALIRRRLEQIEGERSQKKRRIGARASSRGALAYVGGMALEPDKKNLMHELASRFESKTFLPTIGDVRNFFELQHLPIANFKGRSAAAPRIMDALAGLPHETLQEIQRDAKFAGPARLGPLSDAIRVVSARIRAAE